MKRHINIVLAAACMALGAVPAAFAGGAPYEVEYTNEKPLMVIRFNQPHLHYEKPLYDVVSKALDAKPSVMFDVVSVVPHARDSDNQDSYNQAAANNTHKVLATMASMGLPQSRINLTTAQDNVSASEVRIFVR